MNVDEKISWGSWPLWCQMTRCSTTKLHACSGCTPNLWYKFHHVIASPLQQEAVCCSFYQSLPQSPTLSLLLLWNCRSLIIPSYIHLIITSFSVSFSSQPFVSLCSHSIFFPVLPLLLPPLLPLWPSVTHPSHSFILHLSILLSVTSLSPTVWPIYSSVLLLKHSSAVIIQIFKHLRGQLGKLFL